MVQKDDHPAEWHGDRVRTVELTGKKWKVMILVGDVLLYGGVGSTVVILTLGDQWGEPWGMVAMVVVALALPLGALLTVVGRIGRWWHHS